MNGQMKLLAIFFLTILMLGCGSHGHEKVEKEYQLTARGQKVISFKADHPVRVSFSTMMSTEERARCVNKCVRMLYLKKGGDGEAVSSPTSAWLEIKPESAQTEVTLQNMEVFPIKVKVTRVNL